MSERAQRASLAPCRARPTSAWPAGERGGRAPVSTGVSSARPISIALVVALLACICMAVAYRAELVIPHWVVWNDRSCVSDLDGDGHDERVALTGRALVVTAADGSELYRSPAGWKVSDMQVGDVDRDGFPNLVALIWRRGNYGSSRPFWDERTDLRMTEHLYVMSLRNSEVIPTFMSHELGAPVVGIACESDGTVVLTTTDGSETRWAWEGFGLVLQEDVTQR